MSYLILLLILIGISILLYKLHNDILSPAFIYTCSMTVCVISAMIGLIFWNNVSSLKFETLAIIILSVISFAIGEICARKLIKFNGEKKCIEDNNEKNNKFYNIALWKNIAQIAFVLLTIILLYNEVKRIAIIAGYVDGGIGVMIGKFRELSTLYTTDLVEKGQNINFIVSQMRKVCEVLCYINIFFLVSNIVNKKIKNVANIPYLIIITLCLVLSLLTAGRMQILIYFVSAVFIFTILKLREYTVKEFIKKYAKIFVILILIILIGFCLILPLSGRKLNTNIISYLSYYFGISLPSLDMYLDNEIAKPEFFGEETLRGIQTVLYKLNISDYIQPVSKEWLTFETKDNQIYHSNIFTSAKRYYHDFGWAGIIGCQMIFGFVFSYLYLLIKKKNSSIILIFVSMYYYIVIDQIRDELFFSDFVHINTIFKFIMLFIIFYILILEFKNIKIEKEGKKWKIVQKNQ